MANHRLYAFAMKAYGLEDMIYAKGFMKKVLAGEPDVNGRVLVDRLQDSRYQDLATAFNFKAYGQDPTRLKGPKGITAPYFRQAGTYANSDAEINNLAKYFQEKINFVYSSKSIVHDEVLSGIVLNTLGISNTTKSANPDALAKIIDSKLNIKSLHNPRKLSQFIDQFKASRVEARSATVGAYLRQTLETNAGDENEGVRLALYFQRKAATIKSAYSILADNALAEVVRTALGIPAEAARGSIEAQANMINRKIDLSSLQDPDKLDKFLKRFTLMWDTQNSAPSTPALALLGGSNSGLDADLLLKLQSIRLGGR